MTTLYDFQADALSGGEVDLAEYRGTVALVVNTASECGFTPQYAGLERLYQQHKDDGFVVLGFPSDQFGHQEPGSSDEIAEFCQVNFGVTFPLFAKVDVNGKHAHPVWQWLRREQGGVLGDAIKWNFTKFLVGRDGRVLRRYGSTTTPDALEGDIVAALAASPA